MLNCGGIKINANRYEEIFLKIVSVGAVANTDSNFFFLAPPLQIPTCLDCHVAICSSMKKREKTCILFLPSYI